MDPLTAAILGGTTLLGGLMGGKSGGGSSALTNELARISRERYTRTAPLEQDLINRFRAFLGMPLTYSTGAASPSPAVTSQTQALFPELPSGGVMPGILTGQPTGTSATPVAGAGVPGQTMAPAGTSIFSVDPSASPLYGPGKRAIEQQYGRTRENILSTMPEGGQLFEQLANLSTKKGQALSDLEADIGQDFFDKLYGIVSGVPQQAISGLQTAAGISANLGAMESARRSQTMGGLGQGLGMLLAMELMGGKK